MLYTTRLLASFKNNNHTQDEKKWVDLSFFYQYKVQHYPYLLASSASKSHNTQYDILLAFPQYQLNLNTDKTLSLNVIVESSQTQSVRKIINSSKGFFDALEKIYQQTQQDVGTVVKNSARVSSQFKAPTLNHETLPYTGGWFVYLSYEMAQEIEPSLSLPLSENKQVLACAVRCPAAIIWDKKNQQCIAIAEQKYSHLLDVLEQDYLTLSKKMCSEKSVPKIKLKSLKEADEKIYIKQVEKIKNYIYEGDIFQANLSRLWQAELKKTIDDREIYKALSQQNPSSFSALIKFENMSIISSSPERLVSKKNDLVETRPIAGSRPRDKKQKNDQLLAKQLLAHPKEQAEHIMLIDLERNDLGRVCQAGSIEVNELMVLESWQHVHHIVSNIRGKLCATKSPIDLIKAVFPGGTITGCPKVRCIEILAELEQQARGAYTGSLGYLNTDGSMDFNILIRTLVRENDTLTFRAGGGIVNDSIAQKELLETRFKAKGLLKIFDLDD